MYRFERLEKAVVTAVGNEVADAVDSQIATYKVVIYARTGCLYCLRARNTIRKHFGNRFTQDDALFIDLDKDKNGPFYARYVKQLTGMSAVTLPAVFIQGKYIGGMNELNDLHNSGELTKILEGSV